jgi:hypothetical protein
MFRQGYYFMQEVSTRFQCSWGTALYILYSAAKSHIRLVAAERWLQEEKRDEVVK